MKRVPLGQLGKAIGEWAKNAEILEVEVKKAMMRRMLREAVDTSPVREGKYRASHLTSRNTPQGAQLADAPAYPIPGDLESDHGLSGLRFGESVFLSDDAANDGYVYALNVEEKGWGRTPAYEVYQRILDKLPEFWPDALREAVSAVKRAAK